MANTQIIEYKGVEYEFPVTMSDDQIRMHIRRDEESRQMKDFVGEDKPEKPKGMLDRALDVQGQVLDNAKNFAVGAAKGVGNTVYNLGKLAHKLPGMDVIAPDRAGAFEGGPPQALEADGGWQTAGKAAEQVGEFFVPGAATAGKLAPVANALGSGLAGRAATGALTGGGVTAAQGGDPLAGGIAGGAAPIAAAAVGKLAAPIMNSLMQPKKAAFVTGANPGRGAAEAGVVAGSLGSAVKKVEAAREEVGTKIGTVLGLSPQARTVSIDAAALIDGPIGSTSGGARIAGTTESVGRLRQALYDSFAQQGVSPNAVTPAQLFVVKKEIDDAIRIVGNEGPAATTREILRSIRRNFAQAIEKSVPEVRPLNKKYADLSEARTALWDRLHAPAGAQLMSPSNVVAGTGAGLAYWTSNPILAAAVIGTKAATSFTPTATTAAQAARAIGSETGQGVASRLSAAGVSGATRPEPDELQRILSGQR